MGVGENLHHLERGDAPGTAGDAVNCAHFTTSLPVAGGRTYGRPPPRRPRSTPVQRTRTIPCPSGSPVATRAVVPAGVRVPGGGLPAGGAARPAERPPGIRLSQIRDEVTDLRETHDLTPRRLRRVIWPVGFGVAGCGAGKPPRITKPPTHRPYRQDNGITPHPRRTQLKDHTTRMLTRSNRRSASTRSHGHE